MSGPYDELTEDEVMALCGRLGDERCLFALPSDTWNTAVTWWLRLRRRFARG